MGGFRHVRELLLSCGLFHPFAVIDTVIGDTAHIGKKRMFRTYDEMQLFSCVQLKSLPNYTPPPYRVVLLPRKTVLIVLVPLKFSLLSPFYPSSRLKHRSLSQGSLFPQSFGVFENKATSESIKILLLNKPFILFTCEFFLISPMKNVPERCRSGYCRRFSQFRFHIGKFTFQSLQSLICTFFKS